MSHKRVIKGSHVRRRGLPVRGQPGRSATRRVGRPPPARGQAWTWSGSPGTPRGEDRRPSPAGRYAHVPSARPLLPPAGRRRGCGTAIGAGGGAHVAAERPARARGALSARPPPGPEVAGQGLLGEGKVLRPGAQLLRRFLTWEGRYRRPGAGPA